MPSPILAASYKTQALAIAGGKTFSGLCPFTVTELSNDGGLDGDAIETRYQVDGLGMISTAELVLLLRAGRTVWIKAAQSGARSMADTWLELTIVSQVNTEAPNVSPIGKLYNSREDAIAQAKVDTVAALGSDNFAFALSDLSNAEAGPLARSLQAAELLPDYDFNALSAGGTVLLAPGLTIYVDVHNSRTAGPTFAITSSNAANPVQIITDIPHNLRVGDPITISSHSTGSGGPNLNGARTVSAIVDELTFELAINTLAGAGETGGDFVYDAPSWAPITAE